MPLTKDTTAVAVLASTSNAAGSTTTSSAFTIGYGGSVICTITNGVTGPTVACGVTLQLSADNSTYYDTDDVRTAGVASNGVSTFKFDLGVGGVNGGDWTYAKFKFTGNTAQAVTVAAVGSAYLGGFLMALNLAASFSGSNTLNVANYTGNPAAFSVSQWVRPAATQMGRVFFANFLTGGTNKGWATGINDSTNNKVKFYLGTNTLSQTGTLTNNVWTHVICTWDGTTAKIYLNGNTTPDSTLASGVVYGTVPANNYIGTLDGTTQAWNGQLTGVGYWSKALSTTEVASLYNGGRGLAGAELSGTLLTSLGSYHDFLDSANLGTDSSGNGHTFTNTGAVVQTYGPVLPVTGGAGVTQRPYHPVVQRRWSAGLLRAQSLPDSGSVSFRDPASGVTYSPAGTIAWGRNAYGSCMTPNDSTGQGGVNLGAPIASGATTFTMVALASLDTLTGGGSGLRHLWGQEAVAQSMRLALTNSVLFFQVGADAAFTNLDADAPPLNVPTVITCRLAPGGVRSTWYGGVKVAERTDASCVYGSGGGSLVLGTSAVIPARNWLGQVNGGYVWNRALSDAEILSLAADFFAPVRAPRMNPAMAAMFFAVPPISPTQVTPIIL